MITTAHVKVAAKTARYGNVKKAKLAAIAFTKKGEIVATAYNRRLDGDYSRWSDHAEESLIQKLKKLKAFQRYGKMYVLVLRITSAGLSMARPCKRCQKLLDANNVKVMYTHWSGDIMEM